VRELKQLYNPETKEEFLSGYLDEKTREQYRYHLCKSYETEKVLERDLFTFNTDEVMDAFYNANATSIGSLRLTYSIFNQYIKWTIKKGLPKSNINVMDVITEDELKGCLPAANKLFFSEEYIEKLENDLINFRDKVVIRCLFEGIYGTEGLELMNLRHEDIDFDNNRLFLKDDYRAPRTIEVSERCIKFIKGALEEDIYYNKNGLSQGRFATSQFVESDYVVKVALKNKADGRSRNIIYNRINILKEFFDIHYLNPKSIRQSGMLKYAKDFLVTYGQLENKHLEKIAEQYGLQKYENNGYMVYNYTTMRKTINFENLSQLYD
jgi:integrase